MCRLCARFPMFALGLLVALAAAFPAAAQQHLPDSTLYTLYSNFQSSQVNWSTCGSLPLTEGCYGSGSLTGFTNVCSVVQTVPAALNLSTVVRYIYVMDTGSSTNGVTLTAFKRTDTISQSEDTINITRVSVVPVSSLVGGIGVTCMMVQNPTNVYAATNQSTAAVSINKSSYAVSAVGLFSGTVIGITADSYGYVTIDQNNSGSTGNTVYGPNGQEESDGGGAYYMINPIDGVNPANYPFTSSSELPRVGYWPKAGVSESK